MIIIYNEVEVEKIYSPLNMGNVMKLETLLNSIGFKEYNLLLDRAPNTVFNYYKNFLKYISINKYEVAENLTDSTLDFFENDIYSSWMKRDYIKDPIEIFYYNENIIKSTEGKKTKVYYNGLYVYPRNICEVIQAKEIAEWKCEIDSDHETFISESNHNFVEGHHLIPMAKQDLYKNTIDFSANIISLCPNCHRKIHYGKSHEKKELIDTLFKKREGKYKEFGISITLNELYSYYNIY